MKNGRIARRIGVGSVAACLAVALGACGADDGAGEAGSGGAGGDAVSDEALAEARATVEEMSQEPSGIGITAPLTELPPAGTKIAYIGRTSPDSTTIYDAMEEAADVLGVETRYFGTGSTADDFQAAFSAADAYGPDAIWVSGLDPAQWATWGDKWAEEGIPVANQGGAWPNEENRFNFLTVEQTGEVYARLSDWVVADAGGAEAHQVIVTLPAIVSYDQAPESQAERLTELCPTCRTDRIDVAASDIGTSNIASAVTGYLLQNPDTKYVIFDVSSLETGVVGAIRSAGLTGINIVVANALVSHQAELANGDLAAIVNFDSNSQPYIFLDWAARILTGQDTAPDLEWEFRTQLHTQDTIDSFDYTQQWVVPGTAEAWEELWTAET